MNNKVIESGDGKLRVRSSEVTHVCIAPNVYPLLQYILLMDDDVVFHHTCFFVNEVVPDNIRRHLPCQYYSYFGKTITDKICRRLTKLGFRFFKYIKYPFLKTAELYAYDLPYLNLLIGKRNYTLLADAPNWLTLNMQEHSVEYIRQIKRAKSFMGKLLRLVLGDAILCYWGNNPQCKVVLLTEENTSPILIGKEVRVQSLPTLWEQASSCKKQFIMDLFNLTKDDILFLNSRPNVFFSQRLMNDCGLTEKECYELLNKILGKYPTESIVVKTHFKDDFNYQKYFPDVAVFSKPINSQLLYIMGHTPKKLITIASSAIESYPESIECDYYGTSLHPKIERYFGKKYLPQRKVNFVSVY